MKAQIWKWALIATVVLAPGMAHAQCGAGMMGGGHQHGDNPGGNQSEKNDKKTHQAVRKALGDERGRAAVMEEILADQEFMRDLVGRLAVLPEWRVLLTEALDETGHAAAQRPADRSESVTPAPRPADRSESATPAPRPADKSEGVTPAPRPTEGAAVYTCPMHPDVRSDKPGSCPKCGMALEKVVPRTSG